MLTVQYGDALWVYLSVENDAISAGSILPVTGGGAFKFHEILESRLGVKILKLDEMMSAMTGLSFLSCQSNEVYFHDLNQKQRIPKKLVRPGKTEARPRIT